MNVFFFAGKFYLGNGVNSEIGKIICKEEIKFSILKKVCTFQKYSFREIDLCIFLFPFATRRITGLHIEKSEVSFVIAFLISALRGSDEKIAAGWDL